MSNVLPVLAGMLGILTMASMSTFAVAVLAPAAAPALGVDARFIGPFTSAVYLVAALAGPLSGALIWRFGAIRVCQLTMLCSALGMLAFAGGHIALLLPSALLLGLSYGPYNPASAHVLAGVVTERSRPLVFSIKQLGVPLGGALAGALVPTLALTVGWQQATVAVAACALVAALAVQPLRARFDLAEGARPEHAGSGFRASLVMVLVDPVLRRYTLTAFAYAGCQMSMGAFLVVYLSAAVGMSVITAGFALAFMQAGGVAGRVLWGSLAGRVVSSRSTMAFLGLASAVGLVLLARVSPEWSFASLAVLSTALGVSAFGWNGIMLSQIATLAPPGRAADATGGMQLIMFGGVAIFPTVIAGVVAATGGYTLPFMILAALALVGAATVHTAHGKSAASPGNRL